MSHTFAGLLVSPACWAEIEGKLITAGYHHAFHRQGNDVVIDMHGIGLLVDAPEPVCEVKDLILDTEAGDAWRANREARHGRLMRHNLMRRCDVIPEQSWELKEGA